MFTKTMTHQLPCWDQKKPPGFTEIPQLNPTGGWIPQMSSGVMQYYQLGNCTTKT